MIEKIKRYLFNRWSKQIEKHHEELFVRFGHTMDDFLTIKYSEQQEIEKLRKLFWGNKKS